MSLSTHVLDLAAGTPAADIPVTLEHLDATGQWRHVTTASTDATGRAADLLPEPLPPGSTLRLRFATTAYFARQRLPSLFPFVEITFCLADDRHHHVPLLLAANGYTTYRGG